MANERQPDDLTGLGEDLDGSVDQKSVQPDAAAEGAAEAAGIPGRRKRATSRETKPATRMTASDLPDESTGGRGTILPTGGGKDLRLIIIALVGFLVVGGIFAAVAVLAKKSDPQIQRPQITTSAKIGLSAEEEIRAFTQSSSQKILDSQKDIATLRDEIKAIRSDFAKVNETNEKLMNRVLDEFRKAADDRLRSLDTVVKAQVSAIKGNEPQDQRSRAILDEFRTALTTLTMTPAEARVKAAEMLRLAGYQESDITNMLAQVAQNAGRLQVGDLQEKPVSEEVLAKLPKDLAPLVDEGRRVTHAMATFDQVLTEDRVKDRLKKFLSAKLNRGRELTPTDLAQFYECTRVRRENLPDEMQDVIPFLIAQRELLGIRRDDLDGTCSMVWGNRNRYGGQPSAGQLLSLTHVVSRSVPASSSGPADPTAKFSPLTTDQMTSLERVVEQGLENAWNLGRQDEASLAFSVTKVVNNYLEVARASMDPPAKVDFMDRRIKDFLRRKRGSPSTAQAQPLPQPMAAQVQPSTAMEVPREPTVNAGRLRLTKRQFQQAVYLMVPDVLRTAGIQPGDLKGVAATIVLWEQSRRICDQVFPEVAGTSDGAGEAMRLVLPALVEIARAGAGLTDIKIGYPDQRAKPEDQRAMVALLATKVGPVIHDSRLSAEVVAQLDAAFKSATPPDLSQAIRALNAIPVEK
jgi:hypothetical protein